MISNTRWLKNRLRPMSAAEICWRIRQVLRTKRDCLPRSQRNARAAGRVRKRLPPITRPLLISYFRLSQAWKGEDINWQGVGAMPGAQDLHWHLINYRDVERFGDPKLTWELNRHQFLRHWATDPSIDLATKAIIISHLILQWIEKNPYGKGLNWCSSLEVALRLVSWESAVETVGDEHFHPRVMLIIRDSVLEHVQHLQRYPSLYSSANNHRIGELLGQIASAAFFGDEPQLLSQGWDAWTKLQREVKRQVSPDGVSREKALYYHIYVLLFLKRATRYAEQLLFPIAAETRQLLDRMQWFLDASTDVHGHWFELGDRDDGSFAALLPWTQPNVSLASPAPDGIFNFADGGMVIWKQHGLHAMFRAGEFGYPAIAAHAHCDQLSVLLKFNDVDILTDSGTCSYHESDKWRRYFRGTSAHNTVRINGTDQAEYGGPFLWTTTPSATLNQTDSLVTGTLEYQTIRGRVSHIRTATFPNVDTVLTVKDTIRPMGRNPGKIEGELIWNFGSEINLHEVATEESGLFIFHILKAKELLLVLKIQCSVEAQSYIYFGDEVVPAGFLSRQFGQRTSINQLRIAASGETISYTSTFTRPTVK